MPEAGYRQSSFFSAALEAPGVHEMPEDIEHGISPHEAPAPVQTIFSSTRIIILDW